MLTSRLCFGRADDPALLRSHETSLDDGQAYDLLGRSNRVAPAGIGGEAAFFMVYVTLGFLLPLGVILTAIIDDVRQPPRTYALTPDPFLSGISVGRTVLESSLLVSAPPEVPNFATRGLWAPRGCWFQVELWIPAGSDELGAVEIDAVEVEIEVVQEGKTEGPNP